MDILKRRELKREFTYLRLNDKKYNEDLAKIIEAIKSSNLIEER